MKISNNVKLLGESKFINLVQRDFELNGKEYKWFYATRRPYIGDGKLGKEPMAVMIVARDENDDFVLIKQVRYSLSGDNGEIGYEISFPAGLIDGEESVEETAKRELIEETGYEITDIEHVSPPLCNSSGLSDEKVYIVFCNCKKSLTKANKEVTEQIEVITANDIRDIKLGDNVFFGAKTYTIMLMKSECNDAVDIITGMY